MLVVVSLMGVFAKPQAAEVELLTTNVVRLTIPTRTKNLLLRLALRIEFHCDRLLARRRLIGVRRRGRIIGHFVGIRRHPAANCGSEHGSVGSGRVRSYRPLAGWRRLRAVTCDG